MLGKIESPPTDTEERKCVCEVSFSGDGSTLEYLSSPSSSQRKFKYLSYTGESTDYINNEKNKT